MIGDPLSALAKNQQGGRGFFQLSPVIEFRNTTVSLTGPFELLSFVQDIIDLLCSQITGHLSPHLNNHLVQIVQANLIPYGSIDQRGIG